MIRHIRFFYFSVFLLLMLFLSACFKDKFEINNPEELNISPSIAAPVIKTSLGIKDLLDLGGDSIDVLQVEADGTINLMYKGNLFKEVAENLFSIPDESQSEAYSYAIPAGIISDTTLVYSYTKTVEMQADNHERFDSIVFKEGNLTVQFEGNLPFYATYVIESTNIEKDGKPFRDTLVYDYLGFTPVISTLNLDLSGCKIKFDHLLGKNVVNFSYYVVATIPPVFGGDNYYINGTVNLTGLKFSSIYGYLGQKSMSFEPDTIEIDLFKNNVTGKYTLTNPTFRMTVQNSFGLPVTADIDSIYASNGLEPPLVQQLMPKNNGYDVNWNILAPTFFGESVTSELYLDKVNSTIAEVININPRRFIYDIDVVTNPSGDSTAQNFVMDTSAFVVDIEIKMPLTGTATGFVLEDTLDSPFPEDISQINSLVLTLALDNGLPLDADIQLYLVDSNYVIVDSLIATPNQFLQAASGTYPNYVKTKKVNDITLSSQLIGKLDRVKYLIIKAAVETRNQGLESITVNENQTIDIRIGILVNMDLSLGSTDSTQTKK